MVVVENDISNRIFILIANKRRFKILEILRNFRGDSVISENVGNIEQVQAFINELNFDKLCFRRKCWYAGKDVTNTKITAAYRSDHSPIELSLQFVNQVRGSGTWKFNNSLLNDEHYANLVRNCIKDTLSQYEVENSDTDELVYSINPQLLWETIKVMVRGVTISYSSFKKKERNQLENELERKLEELYCKSDDVSENEEIRYTEHTLRELREEKVKGIIMRAKVKWKVEGEKSSKYFCNLEKRHYIEKIISKIEVDGHEITDIQKILEAQKTYYENLYSTHNTTIEQSHVKEFFDDRNPFIDKLNEEESNEMEGNITLNECSNILKSMGNGKSPGLDG